jgi:transcription initiation factor TFIID subunit 2
MGKGFILSSQKVSISIGLNGRIHVRLRFSRASPPLVADSKRGSLQGNTELTIVPTTPDLRTVWLNARSLNVLSTALRVPTTVPLAFSHLPPAPPTLTEPDNIHTYPELKRAVWRGAAEGEEGELGIAIPQGCIVKVVPPSVAEGATPREEAKKEDEWEQIVLVIEYEVVKPGAGIVVVGPDEANPSVSGLRRESRQRELTC